MGKYTKNQSFKEMSMLLFFCFVFFVFVFLFLLVLFFFFTSSFFFSLITAVGLAQSVEGLTVEREFSGSFPGTGPILRVLKITDK